MVSYCRYTMQILSTVSNHLLLVSPTFTRVCVRRPGRRASIISNHLLLVSPTFTRVCVCRPGRRASIISNHLLLVSLTSTRVCVCRPGWTAGLPKILILTKDHAGSGKTCSILQPAAVLKYSGLFLTLVGSMSGVCSTFIRLWITLARVIKPVCIVCVHMEVCVLACAWYTRSHTFTQVMTQG